jgi:hypothetical protein
MVFLLEEENFHNFVLSLHLLTLPSPSLSLTPSLYQPSTTLTISVSIPISHHCQDLAGSDTVQHAQRVGSVVQG